MCSVKRTQVLDDESDYFATESNQWLSTAERDKLRKKEEELRELRHASRKDRKITLDFAGRQVLDERTNLNEYYNRWAWSSYIISIMSLRLASVNHNCPLLDIFTMQIRWDPPGNEHWLCGQIPIV